MKPNGIAHWWTWNVPLSTGISIAVLLGFAPVFGLALAMEQWIIVAGLGLVALTPIVIRWPVVTTFGLYAFLVPFEAVTSLTSERGPTITRLVGILAGIAMIAVGLMERRFVRPPAAALCWGLFMVWVASSAAWALNPDFAFSHLPGKLSLFFLYLTAVSIRPSRKELHWVFLLTVVGGALAGVSGYMFGVDEEAVGGRGRLTVGDTTARNPNLLAADLLLPLSLALGGFVALRGIAQRVMAVGALSFIGLGIFISMSRAGLVAVVAAVSVLVFRLRARWQIVVAAVVLLILAAAMPARFFERISIVFTGEDATGSGRTEIWKVAIKGVEQFWIFGAGLGNFTSVYDLFVAYGPGGQSKGAHSLYLVTWVELGIVGLALLLAAVVGQLFPVLRTRRGGRTGFLLSAMEAASYALLVYGVFDDRIWKKTFWLTWILLTWALRSQAEADAVAEERLARHGVGRQ